MSISVSDRTMCVDERCTIVTSAPFSHSAPQMSNAELLDPTTTHFFPRYASGPGCADEWCCSPANEDMPGKEGTSGRPLIPVASTSCFGRKTTGLPSRETVTVHSPAEASYDADCASVPVQ